MEERISKNYPGLNRLIELLQNVVLNNKTADFLVKKDKREHSSFHIPPKPMDYVKGAWLDVLSASINSAGVR